MFHVVLDIDNVLAEGECVQEALNKKRPTITSWYKNNGLVVITPHILFPAVIEFMQYIFEIPNCRVSFFSGGFEERNTLFVKELLTRALGKESYEKIKANVRIFSSHHLTDTTRDSDTQSPIFYGKKKKDLNITLLPGIPLASTIMIDDNFSYCASGQEKHFLKVSTITYRDIEAAVKKKAKVEDIYRVNNIFYVVGLLKTVIDRECPVTDSLLELQFKKPLTSFVPLDNIGENAGYFLIGLRELRKINSHINFYGNPDRVRRCFNEDRLSHPIDPPLTVQPKVTTTPERDTRTKTETESKQPIFVPLPASSSTTSIMTSTLGSASASVSTTISSPRRALCEYIDISARLTKEACSSPEKAEKIIKTPELLEELLESSYYSGGAEKGGDISVNWTLGKIAKSHPNSAILILETPRTRAALIKGDWNNYAMEQIAKAYPFSERIRKLCGVDKKLLEEEKSPALQEQVTSFSIRSMRP